MQKEANPDYFLWKRVKAGESQAFQELYMLYADILFRFGQVYTKDHEFIKDCIHDLFVDIYKYRKNLSDNDHIRNYLFKSLRRKIQSPQSGKLKLVYTHEIEEESKEALIDTHEEREKEEENFALIRKAVNQLSERQQEALNLRFKAGLPYTEISKIMDITVESARTLVYRSVKIIREGLGQNEGLFLLFLCSEFRFANLSVDDTSNCMS